MANTVVTIENLLDKIAETLVLNPDVKAAIEDSSEGVDFVQYNQQTVKNGIIKIGRENSDKLLLYQTDAEANKQDLSTDYEGLTFTNIVENYNAAERFLESIGMTIIASGGAINSYLVNAQDGTADYSITELIGFGGQNTSANYNPINIGQFLTIDNVSTSVNKSQANEFLDTNIYELLPGAGLRQERIDNAIAELINLLPPSLTLDDFIDQNGRVERVQDSNSDQNGEWVGSQQYYLDNTTSAAQNNEVGAGDEEDGFITRLAKNESTENSLKSIEELRDTLSNYLVDIDEELTEPEDNRLEYRNQSEGYVRFRNLNQGIIIRNTNQDFINGLNPETKDYLDTGFTITMWVRFLDKTSEGTLFNFGNPTRAENPFGFKLETFVVGPDENENLKTEYGLEYNNLIGSTDLFTDGDSERFVRLVVNDDGILYNSHTAMNGIPKQTSLPNDDELSIFTNIKVPQDFNEWYFICATYNSDIKENESFDYTQFQENHLFWMNHINPDNGENVTLSDFGNRCKIEIISRSDLLRARGYKV